MAFQFCSGCEEMTMNIKPQKYIINKERLNTLIQYNIMIILTFTVLLLVFALRKVYFASIIIILIGLSLGIIINYFIQRDTPREAIILDDQMILQYRGFKVNRDKIIHFSEISSIHNTKIRGTINMQMKTGHNIYLLHISNDIKKSISEHIQPKA
jgi:uncharacterized membrane protein YraQ (UPF0718 family)